MHGGEPQCLAVDGDRCVAEARGGARRAPFPSPRLWDCRGVPFPHARAKRAGRCDRRTPRSVERDDGTQGFDSSRAHLYRLRLFPATALRQIYQKLSGHTHRTERIAASGDRGGRERRNAGYRGDAGLEPRGPRTHRLETLFRSRRRLWLPVEHPLLQADTIDFADVSQAPYIMLTVDEAHQTAARYWGPTGLHPNVIFVTSSVEAVRRMVADGLGVTILSDMVYRPGSLEGQGLELRNLVTPIPTMDMGLAWRNRRKWRERAESSRTSSASPSTAVFETFSPSKTSHSKRASRLGTVLTARRMTQERLKAAARAGVKNVVITRRA
jgi:hypothetical protein